MTSRMLTLPSDDQAGVVVAASLAAIGSTDLRKEGAIIVRSVNTDEEGFSLIQKGKATLFRTNAANPSRVP